MKVLIACEFSGRVRDAFLAMGHDAISCDLLDSESPGPHIQGDVLGVLNDGWDLMIAFPPCTYLSDSGVRWLYTQPERWKGLITGAVFFRTLLLADIPRVAVENPIMHRYAIQIVGRRQDQLIQPYMFGNPETKATCLWLKNLASLEPTDIVKDVMESRPKNKGHRVHHTSPGPDRWKLRSRTDPGIADAMADQWGALE